MKLFGNSKGAKTKQTARSAPKKAAESKSPNAQKNKSVKAQKKRRQIKERDFLDFFLSPCYNFFIKIFIKYATEQALFST